jgi:hypothetical protein
LLTYLASSVTSFPSSSTRIRVRRQTVIPHPTRGQIIAILITLNSPISFTRPPHLSHFFCSNFYYSFSLSTLILHLPIPLF